MSLYDPNDDLRDAALNHLIATGRPGLAIPYVRALRSNDNVIVNRAADAIGLIGDHDAIGPLIGALVTKHKVKEGSGPSDQHTYVFTPSGGTAMNMGSSGAKARHPRSRKRRRAGRAHETLRRQLRLRPGGLARLALLRSEGPSGRRPPGSVIYAVRNSSGEMPFQGRWVG